MSPLNDTARVVNDNADGDDVTDIDRNYQSWIAEGVGGDDPSACFWDLVNASKRAGSSSANVMDDRDEASASAEAADVPVSSKSLNKSARCIAPLRERERE